MIKHGVCFLILLAIGFPSAAKAYAAAVPYESYTFDHWGEYVPAPQPYVPETTLNGINLGVGPLSNPSDIFVCPNNDVYIVDSGNDRIVVLDQNLSLKDVIGGFTRNGRNDTFSNPSGIFVAEDGSVYVADTGNNRVVAFAPGGEMFQIIDALPEVAESVSGFIPLKVAVNTDGRVYVIARNIFQGILCYSPESEFITFFGTIKVLVNPWDWFWRIVATQEQRAKQRLYIPIEFNNMDIDGKGFVYTTHVDITNEQKIKRLNPVGDDVLADIVTRRDKNKLIGDAFYAFRGVGSGPSLFVDVKARGSGMYSALDTTRSRVFTYDGEGNLLYVFGGIGNVEGMTRRPVAIEVIDDKILILDSSRGDIVVYKPTEYGRLINQAVEARFNGREQEAVVYWQEVLKLDAHYELAYAGVGKSLLAAGQSKEAMEYLKRGNEAHYYSIALRRYRTEVMKRYSDFIFYAVLLAVTGYIAYRIIKRKRGKRDAHA